MQINKFKHLLTKNNNKIELSNINLVIKNEFNEVERSRRVETTSKYIIRALEYIDKFKNNTKAINSAFIPKNLQDLKKKNIFDKNNIVKTLTARIENLKSGMPNPKLFPNQFNTSLCGSATFFYCLLIDRPDLYVKCVIDLWSEGLCVIKNEAQLNLNQIERFF